MNKRVVKPKRKLPLIPGEDMTDAQIETLLRDNHDEIAAALLEAKAEMDAGKGIAVESLEHFLSLVRGSASAKK
jgi:hypothetical protein